MTEVFMEGDGEVFHYDSTWNIHKRLLHVMAEAGRVAKAGQAPDKIGGYKYVKHDDVAAVIRPLCVKYGVLVVTTVTRWDQADNMTTCDLKTTFVNVDDPLDVVEIDSFGYGIDSGDKGPGKAMSYAAKYALLKQFMLETGDDPEADATQSKRRTAGTPKPSAPKPTKSSMEQIKDYIAERVDKDVFDAYMEKKYGRPFDELSVEEAKAVAAWAKAQSVLRRYIDENGTSAVNMIVSMLKQLGYEDTDLDLLDHDVVKQVMGLIKEGGANGTE